MNATPATPDFIDYADGRVHYADAIPADAEVGSQWVIADKFLVVEAGGIAYSSCSRCSGTGKTPFHWVHGGDCFACGGVKGAGKRWTIAEANKLAVARRRAAERAEAKRLAWVAERDAQYRATVAAYPAVAAAVEAVLAWDVLVSDGEYGRDWDKVDANPEPFEGKLACWLRDLRWIPTARLAADCDRELARIDRLAARKADEAARVAAAGPAPLGVTEFEGKVVSLKWVANDFAPGRAETPKILVVTDAGWKVYATCPRKLLGNGDVVGSRVKLSAELCESKDRDPAFRIGKSPKVVKD
jgi:hypothetical protein